MAAGITLRPLPRILHILPHRGGGGETVVDLLCGLEGFEHRRCYLADARTSMRAAPSLPIGLERARRQAGDADLLHVVGDVSAMLCTHLFKGHCGVWSTQGLHLLRRASGVRGILARSRLRAAVGASRHSICSSRSELDELAELVGVERVPKLVEVPNGVPLPALPSAHERAMARDQLGLDGNVVAALYLGELEERKRPLDAVEATIAARRSDRDGIVLLVAGAGPLADGLGVHGGSAVRMLGFRRDPERLLAAADVFVMPSAREGMSLALLEAMAHGLPVIASDGPGNPEAIGDAGVLHAVGDVDAFAAALVHLAGSADERRRLGSAARDRVEAHFSAERFRADMNSVFRRALSD